VVTVAVEKNKAGQSDCKNKVWGQRGGAAVLPLAQACCVPARPAPGVGCRVCLGGPHHGPRPTGGALVPCWTITDHDVPILLRGEYGMGFSLYLGHSIFLCPGSWQKKQMGGLLTGKRVWTRSHCRTNTSTS
jgi:hypothetical protein